MRPQSTAGGRLTRRRFLRAGLLAGSLALGGGQLAQQAHAFGALGLGAFVVGNATHHLHAQVERAPQVGQALGLAQQAILWKSHQLQVEVGRYAPLYVQQGLHGQQVGAGAGIAGQHMADAEPGGELLLEGVVEAAGGEPGVEGGVDHGVLFGVADDLAGGRHRVDAGLPGAGLGGRAGRADDDLEVLAGELGEVELQAAVGVGAQGVADEAHGWRAKAVISSRV